MPLAYGLIEPVDLSLPSVPATLDGTRIGHVSDLHVVRNRRIYERLINQLASVRLDLLLLTGDYMTARRDESAAVEVLSSLLQRLRPSLGCFGVYGNHDNANLRERLTSLPVTWLEDGFVALEDKPIDLLGFNAGTLTPPDALALLNNRGAKRGQSQGEGERVRIALCHYPQMVATAADLGADILFAGHTHGGQIRLPGGRALVNSTRRDLPVALSSGLMRHQNTLLAVTRGVGTRTLPLRLFCPPHVPVYTLRRGVLAGQYTDSVEMLRRW